jgi:hypothetical protein
VEKNNTQANSVAVGPNLDKQTHYTPDSKAMMLDPDEIQKSDVGKYCREASQVCQC